MHGTKFSSGFDPHCNRSVLARRRDMIVLPAAANRSAGLVGRWGADGSGWLEKSARA
jgi:hypothetical protein